VVNPFSDEVIRFVAANVDSIDQLEILRLLSDNETKHWSPAELADELQTSTEAAMKHIEVLAQRRLLTVLGDSSLVCQHGALTQELVQEVQLLLQAYNERPVTMIRMLEGSVTW
jgi:uncharacterized membrane protein YheB (UPF0754 family)